MGSDGMTTWQKIRVLLAIVFVMVGALFMVAHVTNQSNAAVLIPSGGPYRFQNFDYSQEIAWGAGSGVNGSFMAAEPVTDAWQGVYILVGSGQNQIYTFDNSDNQCVGYDNSADALQIQTCNGATYQQWRSENTSHGNLIYSVWFMNAYPNWCASVGYPGYEAVVTTDSIGGQLHLACPEGYTGNGHPWGLGQWWAANLVNH